MKLFKNSAETLNWHMYFVNSAELTYVFCQFRRMNYKFCWYIKLTYVFCQFRRINYKLRRIDICIILLNYQYHKNTFANSAELSISQGKIGRNVFLPNSCLTLWIQQNSLTDIFFSWMPILLNWYYIYIRA